jgi:hypothetical protein
MLTSADVAGSSQEGENGVSYHYRVSRYAKYSETYGTITVMGRGNHQVEYCIGGSLRCLGTAVTFRRPFILVPCQRGERRGYVNAKT